MVKEKIIQQGWVTLMAIFTWMVVVNGSKLIVDVIPFKNQMIIGIVGIIALLFIRPNNV